MGWTSDRVVMEDTSKGVNFSSDFIYLRNEGCAGSSLLCAGFSSCREQGLPSSAACHRGGFLCFRAWTQQLWRTG